MIFRRLRASPPKFIAFRVACFAIGLIYVLATTETVQVFGTAVELTKEIGAGVQKRLLTQQPQTEKVGTSK